MSAQDLPGLQRRLHGAEDIGALFSRASAEARAFCGYARAVVLTVADGLLVATPSAALEDSASDALRRRVLADPVPLLPGTPEAEAIRRAEGARRARSTAPSRLSAALELEAPALGVVAPEPRALAVVVVDRPMESREEGSVALFAHLLGVAVERAVTRTRMRELAAELRYLTASTGALMREALETPLALPADSGSGATFRGAGVHAALAADWHDLLTDREREIAALLAEGRSNRDIAVHLNLAPDTVKAHVARLLPKLGASNRVQAAVRYLGLSGDTRSG